jgi:ABC-type Fe3+/spermidine/putrescine transport system ATPase subunit
VLLQTQTITKTYGRQEVLRNVSLQVAAGEIVCLLGPSGCGKSTLLRIIAGLEQEYTGSVMFAGRTIDHIPTHQRGFGLMFQDFALFPHRRVGENIAFGLRMQRLPRDHIERRVTEMLELVGLPGYEQRTIFELSGGERQRVALARSLAPAPKLLMLDEPLGALDRTLRERLTDDLRQIIKTVGLTSMYVTHDQVEAFAVADRIMLMNQGEIVQSGTPADVYRQPVSVFAAKFLGLNNLIHAQPTQLHAATPSTDPAIGLETAIGSLVVATEQKVDRPVIVLIRPEAAEPVTHGAVNVVEGQVMRHTFRGSSQRVVLRHSSGVELELDVDAELALSGERIRLALRPDQITILNQQ